MKNEISQILKYTSIAPSSHNTQPWQVAVKGDTILLYADFSRSLHHSDPDNRELYVSLGAALQNTLHAIDGLGYNYNLEYFPESNNELIAKISVKFDGRGNQNNEILEAMKRRHSNRNKYEDKDIPENITNSWKELAKDLGVELCVVRNKKDRSKIGDLVAAGTIDAMKNKAFKKELSKWVRHNLTKASDGMPGYGFNMPTVVSFFSPLAIKYLNIASSQAKLEKTLIDSSPVVCVICGKNNTLSWVKAGRVYERIVVDAEKKNIKSATMTAAVEIGEYHKELMRILGSRERPLVMFRLGYYNKIPKPTPKRSVNEILRD
jgi:hypothetical protein